MEGAGIRLRAVRASAGDAEQVQGGEAQNYDKIQFQNFRRK